MAQVHAIEHADRDDRFAPSCGHLIKALPAVHDSPALLSSPSSLAMPPKGKARRALLKTRDA
jgi:hypothetical protein